MIKILDSFIADKIAAGEVIERPVSAAKELIENSIDAGAGSVIVEIRGGGSTYMRITDDGCGIACDEIETAFLRHATSKISSASDLDNIQSLGFRGEALASISAVSRLTIVSKTVDEISGTKLVLHAGKTVSKEKVGSNKGTTIIIEDLFYNTPARRKFMKTDAREASAVIELVQKYAICYSDIRFMMINNGQTLFTTPGNGDRRSAVTALYPDKAHSSLISVDGDGVKGYVSGPGTTLNSRKGQLFFVNGRPVSSKIIEKAIAESYGDRVFSGFPVSILFINEDPYALDVNIHPGKREILFLHADSIRERIRKAVSEALENESSVPSPELRAVPSVRESVIIEYSPHNDYTDESLKTETAFEVSEQSTIKEYLGSLNRDSAAKDDYLPKQNTTQQTKERTVITDDVVPKILDFDKLILKGYVFSTYIITEFEDAVYIFDQHAAHERIFYEKLLGVYNSDEKLSQPIISPIMINVSADVYQMRDDILELISAMAYDISDFGSGSFIIKAIPSFMSISEAEDFVNAVCSSSEIDNGINDKVIEKLIMKSCKSAVKGGDKLSEIEIQELLKKLSACSNPYSCPHGRPTFIKITRYDMERLFKRR